MSENLPLQSEDPLPDTREYPLYEPILKSNLGEVVVMDEADPFTWLSHIPHANPSDSAKHVMWMLYRMSGHFPTDEKQEKFRDDIRMDHVLKRLTKLDESYVNSYQKHLVKVDANEAAKKLLEATPLPIILETEPILTPVLYEPSPELVALAFGEYVRRRAFEKQAEDAAFADA